MFKRSAFQAVLCTMLFGAALGGASADAQSSYPTKPIVFVLPTGPGATSDTIARTMGKVMSEELKVPIVMDNRPGANGIIGVQHVLQMPADGYGALFTTSSTMVLNMYLLKNPTYDAAADFVPVGIVGRSSLFMAVRGASRLKSVADVIATSRREPNKLTFGSATAVPQLAGEMFKQVTDTQLLHVPYKTQGAMIAGLLAGDIDLTITDNATLVPQFEAGTLRPLAVTSMKRAPAFPDVPTLDESGAAGYHLDFWNGLYVRKGTPPAVIQKLEQAFVRAAGSADMQKYFAINYMEPLVLVGDDVRKFQQEEMTRLGKIVADSRIEPK